MKPKGCHVRIVSGPTPCDTKIYVNDIEIDGVNRIDFEIDADTGGGLPVVRIELFPEHLEILCEAAQVEWNGTPH